VTILADRQLISQAITNVIDNALKYGRGDEQDENHTPLIELKIVNNNPYAEIHIADNGEGISEENKKRVFRRFVRLEESRSKQGSGLGLSMVGAVINAYKGAIRLEDNKPGLRIIMRFPIYRDTERISA